MDDFFLVGNIYLRITAEQLTDTLTWRDLPYQDIGAMVRRNLARRNWDRHRFSLALKQWPQSVRAFRVVLEPGRIVRLPRMLTQENTLQIFGNAGLSHQRIRARIDFRENRLHGGQRLVGVRRPSAGLPGVWFAGGDQKVDAFRHIQSRVHDRQHLSSATLAGKHYCAIASEATEGPGVVRERFVANGAVVALPDFLEFSFESTAVFSAHSVSLYEWVS